MANPGYRPRVYGSKRTGSEWLRGDERKEQALRKDAGESVVPANEPASKPSAEEPSKKFEVKIDRKDTEPLASVVRRYVDAVFEEFGGNKAKTAVALGIGRTTIYRKMGLRKD